MRMAFCLFVYLNSELDCSTAIRAIIDNTKDIKYIRTDVCIIYGAISRRRVDDESGDTVGTLNPTQRLAKRDLGTRLHFLQLCPVR